MLPTVTVAGGARVDYITTTNRGGYFGDRETGNGAASGYVAVTAGSYRGFTLTAQAARGFRDPVLSDRYFRGPSGRGFITGNPDLDPEQSLQFDGGVRYTARRVRAALYGYHYRISNLIERFNQGSPDDFFFRNRGRATLRGVELETQIDLPWRLSIEAAAQVARGKALDGNTALDGITTETGSVQVRRAIGARAFAQAAPRAVHRRRSAGSDRAPRARLHARGSERRRHPGPPPRAARDSSATGSTRNTSPARTCARCSRPAVPPRSPPSCASDGGGRGTGSWEPAVAARPPFNRRIRRIPGMSFSPPRDSCTLAG